MSYNCRKTLVDRLRDWVSKAAERETQRRIRRQDRFNRRHCKPKHDFDGDGTYSTQKCQVTEQLEQALKQG